MLSLFYFLTPFSPSSLPLSFLPFSFSFLPTPLLLLPPYPSPSPSSLPLFSPSPPLPCSYSLCSPSPPPLPSPPLSFLPFKVPMVSTEETPPYDGGVQETGRGGDCKSSCGSEGALPEPSQHPVETDGQTAHTKEVR